MQKIILDTNVVVSALIQKSFPYFILKELFDVQNIQLCISEDLLTEYIEVLNRDKFNRFPDFLHKGMIFLKGLEEHGTTYYPQQKLNIIKDADDNMLLELAEAANADYLITGNSNDFTIASYKNTKIVSPKDYWELYR